MNNGNQKNYTGHKILGICDIVFGIIMYIVGKDALEEVRGNWRYMFDKDAEFMPMLCAIIGIGSIIGGLITLISAFIQESKDARDFQNNQAHMYYHQAMDHGQVYQKICKNCHEANDINARYCRYCNQILIDNNSTVVSHGDRTWICPKCGKINQYYVGACGCGQEKP